MDENRVITASFGEGEHSIMVAPVYQYNYGNIIRFVGIELPYAFEVHFANDQYGDSTTSIGSNNEVEIPDAYLTHDGELYAWVFLHDDVDDGETKYQVIIPIVGRARVTDGTPTPVQQDAITQAIAALDSAVADCEGCVSNYPQIIEGYWWVYDAEADEMVNSGIKAVGTDGADGAKGDKGDKGDQGIPGDPTTLIDDTTTSVSKTYSSDKIYHTHAKSIFVGTCSTAGNVSAKEVSIPSDQNYVLEVGTTIQVKFSNTNSASNVTISVNGGTAYPIWYNTGAYTGSTPNVCGNGSAYFVYTFNGSYWVWVSMGKYNSYNAMSQAQAEDGTSTSNFVISPATLKGAIKHHSMLGAYIGTCDTAGATSAKQVTISSDQNFVLEKGAVINVKYANNNSASNVTISVNGGTAYPIYYAGSEYTNNVGYVTGRKDTNLLFVFDGSYWVWQGFGQYISYTTMTQADAEGGTSTTGRIISAQVLKQAIQYHAPDAIQTTLNKYSTTEKAVGVWIDDSTVYEKTI